MNNPTKKIRLTPAEVCWVGLGLGIIATDAVLMRRNCETMSVCFGRWIQSPRGKLLCATGTGALIAHLFWSIPIPGQTRFRMLVTYKPINGNRNETCLTVSEVMISPQSL